MRFKGSDSSSTTRQVVITRKLLLFRKSKISWLRAHSKIKSLALFRKSRQITRLLGEEETYKNTPRANCGHKQGQHEDNKTKYATRKHASDRSDYPQIREHCFIACCCFSNCSPLPRSLAFVPLFIPDSRTALFVSTCTTSKRQLLQGANLSSLTKFRSP